ncbi:ankyrin-1-like [Phymastichus coffea]|uniref:ankyrin-1-like n=1 Tax=Phymastichus coffea TaxID=108790 RepID=UPI00273C1023|nr:ankyrin-1-like [Phymastichus coffea]
MDVAAKRAKLSPEELSDNILNDLHYAAKNGNAKMVKRLLSSGCDVDMKDAFWTTALMLAVDGSHESTIAVLLKFNADIYAKDKFERSVLQRVFGLSITRKTIILMFLEIFKRGCNNSEEIAMKLMEVGCPLYWAILLSDTEVTRFMLDSGYVIDGHDTYRPKPALHVSLELRDFANAKLLLEYNADVHAIDVTGRTALACLGSFDDSNEELEVLEILINRHMNEPSRSNSYKLAQLRTLLKYGQVRALKMLLGRRINWCAEDFYLKTPLHYLMTNTLLRNNPHLVYLMQLSSLYNVPGNILSLAALRGFTSFVEVMLKKGADPNDQCEKGNTPLLDVCLSTTYWLDRREVISLLLMYNADPTIVNYEGESVLDVDLDVNYKFQLIKCIIGQLVMMELRGVEIPLQIRRQIFSENKTRKEYLLSRSQLERLRHSFVGDSIRIFELFTTSVNTIALYIRDRTFVSDMRRIRYSTLNFYFSFVLKKKFKAANHRKITLDRIRRKTGFHYDFYPTIVDTICNYLLLD